jgi:hypothetical protein
MSEPDRADTEGMSSAPRPVDVLWLVEHVARELDVACAASQQLSEQYGRTVVIEPVAHTASRVRATYEPRVVITPYLYSDQDWGVREYVTGWTHPPVFFNLSWEELYCNAQIGYKTPRDPFTLGTVIHHAWGDFFKDFLIESGVPEEHVRVNGQPAYGLFDEPYRRVFKTRADLAASTGLDPDKRWVFFAESYVWAFFNDIDIECRVAVGASRADVEVMQAYCCDSLVQTVLWLLAAAREGSVEVIVRPRPATDLNALNSVVRQLSGAAVPPRLHVTKAESVREWLLASDLAFSSYSTTMIEAALAGKPAYFLEPIPIPPPLQVGWHAHVPRIRTQAEFMKTVRRRADLSAGNGLERWARSELVGRGDPIAGLAAIVDSLAPPTQRRSEARGLVIGPPDSIPHQGVDRFTHQDVDRLVRSFAAAREPAFQAV